MAQHSTNKRQSSKRQVISKVGLLLVFLVGALLFCYPFYINALNGFLDQQHLKWNQEKTAVENKQKEQQFEKANQRVAAQGLAPSAVSFDTKAAVVSQAYLKQHLIGSVVIPTIHVNIPLYDTTNDSLLQVGATVVQGTSFPTGKPNTHTLIAAHSGLPQRNLFTNLEDVKMGQQFVVTVLGEKRAYQVDRIQVVKPEDTKSLKIEMNRELITLITCTPYMINTDRLLVTGHRIPYTAQVAHQVKKSEQTQNWQSWSILGATLLFVLGMVWLFVRIIRQFFLGRRIFTVLFQLSTPAPNLSAVLQTANGKRTLHRNGEPFRVTPNSNGELIFADLPGGKYRVRFEQEGKASRLRICAPKKGAKPYYVDQVKGLNYTWNEQQTATVLSWPTQNAEATK